MAAASSSDGGGVLTVAKIEARANAVRAAFQDLCEYCQTRGAYMSVLVRGEMAKRDDSVFDVASLRFEIQAPVEARGSALIFDQFLADVRLPTRFYMMFDDAKVYTPGNKGFGGIDAYMEEIVALANRIEEEDLPPRTRTKALESVVEALADLEEQVGAFHGNLIPDGGIAHARELVETMNATLSELRTYTECMFAVKRNRAEEKRREKSESKEGVGAHYGFHDNERRSACGFGWDNEKPRGPPLAGGSQDLLHTVTKR